MASTHAAAIVAAGTAVVLAPIDPQVVRDLNDAHEAPEPGPTPESEPTPVLNFDNHGTYWGCDTVANTEALIARERAAGTVINEWNVTDRDGQPMRIVRCADPDFLDTICVIPAVQLPTTPDALADHILTVGDAGLLDDLTAQIGGRHARRILAEAYSIASDRLWNS